MGILETPDCLFRITKTIEHTSTDYHNARNLWKVTEDFVMMMYDTHIKISDIEEIFVENNNGSVKQSITLNVKDVIYLKRNAGKE